MRLTAAKADAREVLGRIAAASIVVLIFIVNDHAGAIALAAIFALLAGVGFLLARLGGRRAVETPVPRALRRRWAKGSFRRAAYDQPFNTHLGWTSGSEPGGTLPDARRVVPQGSYGVGDLTDTVAGLLVIVAIFLSATRYGNPLGGFLLFGTLGLIGFGLIRFTRWVRHR